MAAALYRRTVCRGVAYHFFVSYARIDCDLSDSLRGTARKRHQKAYADLMFLLTERKALVEQYFCATITDKAFDNLCKDLYYDGSTKPSCDIVKPVSEPDAINSSDVHLPYTLECRFTKDAIDVLYSCFIAHDVFKDLTLEDVTALFDGSLKKDIKCKKGARLGYIMHHLSVAGLITSQYQKAIGRCGYILSPKRDEPMTAERLKEAVKRAKVYTGNDMTWTRTINSDLNRVFELMGVSTRLS